MEQMNASGTARRDGYYPNTMEVDARLAGDADQFLLPQNWDLNWIKSIRTIKL